MNQFDLNVSVPLVIEYEDVLTRQRHKLGLTEEDVADVVDALCTLAVRHKIYFLWRPYLRDAKDEHVLELAVAARCGYIVTFNKKDFRGAAQFGIEVVSPKDFLQEIGVLP